ncbi:hypothetical protein GCM10023067_45700 [Aminobacter aganoensis]
MVGFRHGLFSGWGAGNMAQRPWDFFALAQRRWPRVPRQMPQSWLASPGSRPPAEEKARAEWGGSAGELGWIRCKQRVLHPTERTLAMAGAGFFALAQTAGMEPSSRRECAAEVSLGLFA